MIGIVIDACSQDDIFPNKIFHKFNGKTVLEIVINKALQCEFAQRIIVVMPSLDKTYISGTTFQDSVIDTSVMRYKRPAIFHFSDAKTAIQRIYNAALEHGLDYIIKISADCPLLPTWLYSQMILYYKYNNLNVYMKNLRYQDGLQVEIIPFWMLADIIVNCEDKHKYDDYLTNKWTVYEFKDTSMPDVKIPSIQFDLRFKNKNQITEFDYIIESLSSGIDLEDILLEK